MICYTIDQAAQRVHRTPETIRRWIRQEMLVATFEPITGMRYVQEEHLLVAERESRLGKRKGRWTSERQPERVAS
ncbi:MerR family transcriptional regulator [Kineosporia succinea]|uniref:DNA-binding transcriptional MerR regulator n=1 Tax=Kineosporia succinea TaxID=84632 RepID=A0ABT9P9W8_9ACTN|nr:MerR family transcriptional regulator [Kineosporia succinea]MDP9829473.1 DNA-binding transcriptional MerR regulator [Kineosporia succinea]